MEENKNWKKKIFDFAMYVVFMILLYMAGIGKLGNGWFIFFRVYYALDLIILALGMVLILKLINEGKEFVQNATFETKFDVIIGCFTFFINVMMCILLITGKVVLPIDIVIYFVLFAFVLSNILKIVLNAIVNKKTKYLNTFDLIMYNYTGKKNEDIAKQYQATRDILMTEADIKSNAKEYKKIINYYKKEFFNLY